MVYCGGCPNAGTDQCEFVSCTLMFSNCHLLLELSGYLEMALIHLPFISSQVNFILGCMEFRCCRKLFLFSFLIMVKVSSTNLLHIFGGVLDVLIALISRSSRTNKPAQDHKSRRGHRQQHLQEAIPHRGSTTQILWSAQDTQAGHTTQAHNIQLGLSKLWDSKRNWPRSLSPS